MSGKSPITVGLVVAAIAVPAAQAANPLRHPGGPTSVGLVPANASTSRGIAGGPDSVWLVRGKPASSNSYFGRVGGPGPTLPGTKSGRPAEIRIAGVELVSTCSQLTGGMHCTVQIGVRTPTVDRVTWHSAQQEAALYHAYVPKTIGVTLLGKTYALTLRPRISPNPSLASSYGYTGPGPSFSMRRVPGTVVYTNAYGTHTFHVIFPVD